MASFPHRLLTPCLLLSACLLLPKARAQLSNCSAPTPIGTLPFASQNLSTCNTGNDLLQSPCSNTQFLATEDHYFRYESPGEECLHIALTHVQEGTGLGVYYGCPDTAGACVAQVGGVPGVTDVALPYLFLPWAGTYFFVVDNAVSCTDFDLLVERRDCPVVFPNAALCNAAISMNGCQGVLPGIHIAAGEGNPDFIQPSVNDGCWAGAFPLNFTWFSFRAAASGSFAFTLQASIPAEASDLDFQIWGPVSTADSLCDYAKLHQPSRSSFAAGKEPTGLAAIHPVLGTPVLDTCEGASGDDFVAPLEVLQGQWYGVLVNDWGGALTSGSVTLDFSGTAAGVLAETLYSPAATTDTVICPGDTALLCAEGGLSYEWLPANGLSCRYCQQSTASPVQDAVYSVAIHTLCRSDTLQTAVSIAPAQVELVISPDTTLCGLHPVLLSAIANLEGSFTWLPAEVIGSSFTPTPQQGSFQFTVLFEDNLGCVEQSAAVSVEWLPSVMVTQVVALPGDTVYVGELAQVFVLTSPPSAQIYWQDGSSGDTLTLTPTAEGLLLLTVVASSDNGCADTAGITLVVRVPGFDIPNAFTPNGDAFNQRFAAVIQGNSIQVRRLRIWDRWGRLVYEGNDPQGWDGTHDGQRAPSDVYIYWMEVEMPGGQVIVRRGEVTLLY